MGTIANKLNYILDTKEEIRQAIIEQGVEVDEDVTFREYADKVLEIEGGSTEKKKIYIDNGHSENIFYSTNMPVQNTFQVVTAGLYFCWGCCCQGNHNITSTGTEVYTRSFSGVDSGHYRYAELRFFKCEIGDTITIDFTSDIYASSGIILLKNCSNVVFKNYAFNVDTTSNLSITSTKPTMIVALVTGRSGARTITENTIIGDLITKIGQSGSEVFFDIIVGDANNDFDISAYGFSHGCSLLCTFELKGE